jgi:hypothetical protein
MTFNKDKARNRYRELKGIPLDKPITQIIVKKKKRPGPVPVLKVPEPFEVRSVPKPKPKPKPKSITPLLSEEEQKKRQLTMAKLLGVSTTDDGVDDDW